MATIDEQIKSLEEEISKTKYNKATQGHIGKLKLRLPHLGRSRRRRWLILDLVAVTKVSR